LVVLAGAVEGQLECVGTIEGDEAGIGLQPRALDDTTQLDSLPLADATPSLDAIVSRDLSPWGHASQLLERQLQRPLDEPADGELPVDEATLGKSVVLLGIGVRRAIRAEFARDVLVGVLARQRLPSEEDALHSVIHLFRPIEGRVDARGLSNAVAGPHRQPTQGGHSPLQPAAPSY